jgi:CheY-like chemotaxis protein
MDGSSNSPTQVRTKPLTIALADDMPEIQALAATWLSGAGHTVLCAANGAELLRMLRDKQVDVVITDVMMPQNDGFEVIQAVKKLYPGVKIITISGGADVMPMRDCLRVARALGADAVLAKPFNKVQLFTALDSAQSA